MALPSSSVVRRVDVDLPAHLLDERVTRTVLLELLHPARAGPARRQEQLAPPPPFPDRDVRAVRLERRVVARGLGRRVERRDRGEQRVAGVRAGALQERPHLVLGQVLEHLRGDQDVVVAGEAPVVDAGARDVRPRRRVGMLDRPGRHVEAPRLAAERAQRAHQEALCAADVEEALRVRERVAQQRREPLEHAAHLLPAVAVLPVAALARLEIPVIVVVRRHGPGKRRLVHSSSPSSSSLSDDCPCPPRAGRRGSPPSCRGGSLVCARTYSSSSSSGTITPAPVSCRITSASSRMSIASTSPGSSCGSWRTRNRGLRWSSRGIACRLKTSAIESTQACSAVAKSCALVTLSACVPIFSWPSRMKSASTTMAMRWS